MNWNLLVATSLAFGLLFVIVMTLGYYIRYKRDQKTKKTTVLDPDRGRYFEKHVMTPVTVTNSMQNDIKVESRWQQYKNKMYAYSHIAPFVAFAAMLLGYFVIHFYQFSSDVKLTSEELAGLKFNTYKWKEWQDPSIPEWHVTAAKLKSFNILFLKDNNDSTWFVPDSRHNPTGEVESAWGRWASANELEIKSCTYQDAQRCLSNHKKNMAFIMPGYWNFSVIEKLLQRGTSVLLLGPPAQVFQEGRQVVEWNGLTFERSAHEVLTPLMLRGDRALSLGWNAGQLFDLHPLSKAYRAVHASPDAYRPGRRSNLRGEFEAGLVSGYLGSGRWVWMDVWPERNLALAPIDEGQLLRFQSSVFRYLSNQSYQALAHWPEGKSFVYFTGINISNHLSDFDESLDALEGIGLQAASFALAGDSALADWPTTRDLAEFGGLECFGAQAGVNFQGESMLEQAKRLALCQKMLKTITDINVMGFRAPAEKFDETTLNAMVNVGYEYLLSGNTLDYVTPQLREDSTEHAQVILIGRMNSSDLDFLEGVNQKGRPERVLLEELQWVQQLGGLFALNYHGQNLNKENLEALKGIIETVKNRDGFAMRPAEIAWWWRTRAKLAEGVPALEVELNRFKPVLLRVTDKGELVREVFSTSRGISSQLGGSK